MFFGWEPQRNAKIHNLRGAVEGGDGVAVVLGVLQKLEEVVSGDNTGRDVAGSNHGCSSWIWCVSNWKNYCSQQQKATQKRDVEERTRVKQNWKIGRTLISRSSGFPVDRLDSTDSTRLTRLELDTRGSRAQSSGSTLRSIGAIVFYLLHHFHFTRCYLAMFHQMLSSHVLVCYTNRYRTVACLPYVQLRRPFGRHQQPPRTNSSRPRSRSKSPPRMLPMRQQIYSERAKNLSCKIICFIFASLFSSEEAGVSLLVDASSSPLFDPSSCSHNSNFSTNDWVGLTIDRVVLTTSRALSYEIFRLLMRYAMIKTPERPAPSQSCTRTFPPELMALSMYLLVDKNISMICSGLSLMLSSAMAIRL